MFSKKPGKWVIIFAIVITAVVSGAVVYALQKSNLKNTEQSLQQQISVLENQVSQLQEVENSQNQQVNQPYTEQNNQSTTQEEVGNVIEEQWKMYSNKELGISFLYLPEWGEVVEKTFDSYGKSEYFEFSNVRGAQLGGLYVDYFENDPGRGGSLIDSQKLPAESGYQISQSTTCAYNTDLDWFGTKALHATCLTGRDDFPAFNFADGGNPNKTTLDEDDFIKMVESFRAV